MDVRIKAIFLLFLIGSIDAHRITQHSSLATKIRDLSSDGGQRQAADMEVEATAANEFWERSCDNDVVVQARWWVDWHRKTVVGRLRDLVNYTTPVLVGSKARDGCRKDYSLMCKDGILVLRKDSCDGSSYDKHFGWLSNWESAGKKSKDTTFKFDPDFIKLAFPPDAAKEREGLECKRVIWTATEDKCDSAFAAADSTQGVVMSQIDDLKAAEASGDGEKTETAARSLVDKLRDFADAMSSSRKKGCFPTGSDVAAKESAGEGQEAMTGKLRDLYISTKGEDIGEAAAAENYDAALEMMKESGRTRSLKGLVNAVRLIVKGPKAVKEETEEQDDEAAGDDLEEEDLEELVESEEVQKDISQKFDAVIGSKGASLLQTSSGKQLTKFPEELKILLFVVLGLATALAVWFLAVMIAYMIVCLVLGIVVFTTLKVWWNNARDRRDSDY